MMTDFFKSCRQVDCDIEGGGAEEEEPTDQWPAAKGVRVSSAGGGRNGEKGFSILKTAAFAFSNARGSGGSGGGSGGHFDEDIDSAAVEGEDDESFLLTPADDSDVDGFTSVCGGSSASKAIIFREN